MRWPVEWQGARLTPADLDLPDGDWYMEIAEASRHEGLSIEQVITRWPLGPWVGLGVKHDLPPGGDGFGGEFGSCWWRSWWSSDGFWRQYALIEYPSSSLRRDERWTPWLRTSIADAKRVFEASVTLS